MRIDGSLGTELWLGSDGMAAVPPLVDSRRGACKHACRHVYRRVYERHGRCTLLAWPTGQFNPMYSHHPVTVPNVYATVNPRCHCAIVEDAWRDGDVLCLVEHRIQRAELRITVPVRSNVRWEARSNVRWEAR